MNLKSLLRKEKNRIIISGPDIKINKYLSMEFGNYWSIINDKPTKDMYFGLKFKIDW